MLIICYDDVNHWISYELTTSDNPIKIITIFTVFLKYCIRSKMWIE